MHIFEIMVILALGTEKKKRESTGNREVRRETRKRRECKTANVFLSMQSAHGLELLLLFFFPECFLCQSTDLELWEKSLSVRYEEKVKLFNISIEPH